MRILRPVAVLLAAGINHVSQVAANSLSRNPLVRIGAVHDSLIQTGSSRVNAFSHFNLDFTVYNHHVRLSLEPNHDVIADGATIQYMSVDGEVVRTEPIQRTKYKIFKGTARVQTMDGGWDNVGWARVMIMRDGPSPLFEGAFTINHNHHHVELSTNYERTKLPEDPAIETSGGEYMVVWRDTDISSKLSNEHTELKKRGESLDGCRSDYVEFNQSPDHPIRAMPRRVDQHSKVTPVRNVFKKRQIDNTPGAGNSGGNLVASIGNTAGCPSTRKVALVGVATDCTYTASFTSKEEVSKNVIKQMGLASSLFEQSFNITLGLANLTISDASCPGTPPQSMPWNIPCSGNIAIEQRLSIFAQWRGERQDSNSHWTLLSTCGTGAAVGIAWLGQACVQGSQSQAISGGNNQTIGGANLVVKTNTEWQVIAHETGHTFGAVHDCTSDSCADPNIVNSQQCCPLSSSGCDAGQKFIMNPSANPGITQFSPCTIGNICSALQRQSVKSSCLTNNKGVVTITGAQCGNGIVEGNEDCDCGGEASCGNNKCCDPKTCKFKSGAVCDDSNEECCNSCQFAPSTKVCRASIGVCDPEEKCTGSSPYCPTDSTNPDGTDCGNGLTCSSGQCTSRDLQCKTIMGSYTQGNDTYACDQRSCQLACASPEFGPNQCYGLKQNFLDGTDCGGGGKCRNGMCLGYNFGKEIGSWITQHKGIVIGVATAVGVLLLIALASCCWSTYKRRRGRGRGRSRRHHPHGANLPYGPWANNNRGRSGPPNGSGGGPLMSESQPPPGGYYSPPFQQANSPPSRDIYPPTAPPPAVMSGATSGAAGRSNQRWG